MALKEKWIAVFEENEELMRKVIPMQPEEAQQVLAANGYTFSMEEILEAGKELYAMREGMNQTGELSVDDLDAVAGGAALRVLKTIYKAASATLVNW